MMKALKKDYFVQSLFYLLSFFTKKKYVMFIPHMHMCDNDMYSIINYKSDNALTLANYILSKDLLNDKKIAIGISLNSDIHKITDYLKDNFPSRKIEFVYPFIKRGDISSIELLKKKISLFYKMAMSSHVFTSQTHLFRPLARSHKIMMVDLGYYVAPIKNSTHDKKSKLYIDYQSMTNHDYDYYIVTSEVSKRLIMASYSFKYDQFKILGMCRNDYLYSSEMPSTLKKNLLNNVPYPVKKIVLYVPTHRDNINGLKHFSAAKNLFGFDADLVKIDKFLKKEGIYMLCKVHPKQHSEINICDLPSSICLFKANNEYGLAELMKVSDALVTDYTSGYFDYLILDKPVVFNLYDDEQYNSARGLIFDPIDSICAGDIIRTQDELVEALAHLEENKIKYSKMRHNINAMLNKYQDSNTCQRIYDCFFKE